jgi:hypothetical protein
MNAPRHYEIVSLGHGFVWVYRYDGAETMSKEIYASEDDAVLGSREHRRVLRAKRREENEKAGNHVKPVDVEDNLHKRGVGRFYSRIEARKRPSYIAILCSKATNYGVRHDRDTDSISIKVPRFYYDNRLTVSEHALERLKERSDQGILEHFDISTQALDSIRTAGAVIYEILYYSILLDRSNAMKQIFKYGKDAKYFYNEKIGWLIVIEDLDIKTLYPFDINDKDNYTKSDMIFGS